MKGNCAVLLLQFKKILTDYLMYRDGKRDTIQKPMIRGYKSKHSCKAGIVTGQNSQKMSLIRSIKYNIEHADGMVILQLQAREKETIYT